MTPSYHCPICQEIGTSISAIYARDTSNGTIHGNFNGVGLGLSVGSKKSGISGAGYGGRFEAKTNTVTTLAKIFEPMIEPIKPKRKKIITKTFITLVAIVAIMILSYIFAVYGNSDTEQTSFISTNQYFYLSFILIMGIVATVNYYIANNSKMIASRFKKQSSIYKEEKEKYDKFISMYKTLRYCEKCHVVYDQNGYHQHADIEGYNKIINVNI